MYIRSVIKTTFKVKLFFYQHNYLHDFKKYLPDGFVQPKFVDISIVYVSVYPGNHIIFDVFIVLNIN